MTELINGKNRSWTTSEEADISCYTAPGVEVDVQDDFAVFYKTDDRVPHVKIWAIGDNLYVGHYNGRKGSSTHIYWTTHLKDVMDFAVEAVSMS